MDDFRRSGWQAFAVDLLSWRVTALKFVDGVLGSAAADLLGYRLVHGLHEAPIDVLIHAFRRAYALPHLVDLAIVLASRLRLVLRHGSS